MDTFFEQIISIKKTAKTYTLIIAIWLFALLLSFLTFLFSGVLGSLFVIVIAGIIYGAYKLTTMLNVEYEYIITNGLMDVDRIINKSNRKRFLSFELSSVTRLEKYNPFSLNNVDSKKILFTTDKADENAYLLVYEKEGKGTQYLVFSPNDKLKSAIVGFLPKYIANSAFK